MLIVLLPDAPIIEGLAPATLYWWRTSREGVLLESGEDGLRTLRLRFPAERLRMLAPASVANLYRVAMPVRRASAARAALPYALEDQLGQELDELHLVPGPRRADGRFVAAVVEHRCMQDWVGLATAAGWRPEALIPQASLHHDQTPAQGLRVQPSPWPGQQDWALITSADQEPVLVERGMLGFWLKQRLNQLDDDQRIIELLGYLAAELGLAAAGAQVSDCDQRASLEAALKNARPSAQPLNLLVGAYASGMAAPPWRKLRPVLAAAAVLLVVVIAQQVLQGLALNSERERLQVEIDQLFDDTLPRSRRVDPVTQFRQVLQGAADQGGGNGMGSLLHDVLAPVGAEGGVKIRQFRASPGEVELELQLPSFAELEKLRGRLAADASLNETLQGADSDGEGVTARLRVQRKES